MAGAPFGRGGCRALRASSAVGRSAVKVEFGRVRLGGIALRGYGCAMKWLDLPPVWLAAFAALGWAQARHVPLIAFGSWAIYLGGALVLAGRGLRWDSPIAIVCIPVFMWVVTRRFILGEEARLSEKFGAAFDDYAAQVRRWI